jgi:hypothetical protein
MKPTLTLKVGGSYLNRRGERITIECETTAKRTNQFAGINADGHISFYSRRGRYTSYPHKMDLIEETGDESTDAR